MVKYHVMTLSKFHYLEEPGGLRSTGSQRVGQDRATKHSSFLYGPTLTSIHDHWKNHNFD